MSERPQVSTAKRRGPPWVRRERFEWAALRTHLQQLLSGGDDDKRVRSGFEHEGQSPGNELNRDGHRRRAAVA